MERRRSQRKRGGKPTELIELRTAKRGSRVTEFGLERPTDLSRQHLLISMQNRRTFGLTWAAMSLLAITTMYIGGIATSGSLHNAHETVESLTRDESLFLTLVLLAIVAGYIGSYVTTRVLKR